MLTRLVVSLTLVASAGCASQEPTESPQPKTSAGDGATPKPKPEPKAEPVAKAAIASVQMIQDCPDPEPAAATPAAAEPAAAEPAAKPSAPMPVSPPAQGSRAARRAVPQGGALGDVDEARYGGLVQPCTQSTVQIAFSGQGDTTETVKIQAVRLLMPDGSKTLATLDARGATIWTKDGKYVPWDGTIGPHQEVKASYKLSVPDWNTVDEAIGPKGSMGHMFLLELDIDVGTQRQTVRSPQFPREEPHVIVT